MLCKESQKKNYNNNRDLTRKNYQNNTRVVRQTIYDISQSGILIN